MQDTQSSAVFTDASRGDGFATYGTPRQATSIVHSLDWFARKSPQQPVYSHLLDGESDADTVTFLELAEEAQGIASWLLRRCEPGDRVVLAYNTGLDFVKAFIGCLYAGVIPAPAPSVDIFRWESTAQRIQSIIASCRPRAVLTTSELAEQIQSIVSDDTGMEVIPTDLAPITRIGDLSLPELTDESLAFLQYTSGSTGSPRGVMVSHGNLRHNVRHLLPIHPAGGVGVSWLPLHHDMGLIGGVLPSLWSGGHVVLLSPEQFVERPLRWLSAISRYGAYISGAPNFAYDLCLKKITPQDRDQLDLSRWTFAAVGAEVIRPNTLRRFAEYFGPCGFRMESFRPSYGLAECTLYVSVGHGFASHEAPATPDHAIPSGRHGNHGSHDEVPLKQNFVNCGRPIPETDVKIVDGESQREVADETVGEVWVGGPSVALGYWNDPNQTEGVFRNTISGRRGSAHYCRTGDLGFVSNGQLYITGRIKELIIVNGKNLYPTDVEATVEAAHDRIAGNRAVAFAIDRNDQERLAVIYEVRGHKKLDMTELMAKIRQQILAVHGVQPLALVAVPVGSLPRTTSGKKERLASRRLYLSHSLETIAEWQDEDASAAAASGAPCNGATMTLCGVAAPTVPQIVERLGQILLEIKGPGVGAIRPETRMFAEIGLASIDMMAMHEQIEGEIGRTVDVVALFARLSEQAERDITIGAYAAFLEQACRG